MAERLHQNRLFVAAVKINLPWQEWFHLQSKFKQKCAIRLIALCGIVTFWIRFYFNVLAHMYIPARICAHMSAY